MSEIADRIRQVRRALGLTQEALARRAGIPKRTLVGYENSEREPGAAALAAIAKTGVNMTWLLTGEGEMFNRPGLGQAAHESASAESGHVLPSSHPRARRWDHLIRLVEQIEDDARRDAVLSELFARAQDAAQIDELQRAVRELRAARGR
jgi:transcriptional regulator with XRE-family HTH domain